VVTNHKPYQSEVSDEEWSFVAAYLRLMKEQAPQRKHDLREVFNALHWMAPSGAAWRMLPTNFPP
jgi:transposase